MYGAGWLVHFGIFYSKLDPSQNTRVTNSALEPTKKLQIGPDTPKG